MAVLNYRELIAWQRAMDLVVAVYALTCSFPREEIYALANQLRRAAVSVPSNIAEGQGRGVGKSFVMHLRIARGSLQEIETQVLVAERLGYIREGGTEKVLHLSDEVSRLVTGLIRSVETNETF